MAKKKASSGGILTQATPANAEVVSEEKFSKSPGTYLRKGCREHPVVVQNKAGEVVMVIGSPERTPAQAAADEQEYQEELERLSREVGRQADARADDSAGSYFI